MNLHLIALQSSTLRSKMNLGIKLVGVEGGTASIQVGLTDADNNLVLAFPVTVMNLGDVFTVGGLTVNINFKETQQ